MRGSAAEGLRVHRQIPSAGADPEEYQGGNASRAWRMHGTVCQRTASPVDSELIAIAFSTQGKTVEQLGEDFGSYCAAWEDGACGPSSCLNVTGGPGHKCGTLKECTALWPSDSTGEINYDQSQPWCCDAWCYVDNTTCTDAIQVPACERAV